MGGSANDEPTPGKKEQIFYEPHRTDLLHFSCTNAHHLVRAHLFRDKCVTQYEPSTQSESLLAIEKPLAFSLANGDRRRGATRTSIHRNTASWYISSRFKKLANRSSRKRLKRVVLNEGER
jgi:hypothetical protein